MSLDILHNRMDWPKVDELIAPQGIGPRVLTELAREKIERAIQRELGGESPVRVGLLTKNPSSSNTEAPIAVVCEFPRAASDAILALAHRLAWNFARSPLLITVEPHVVRTWSCCEPPDEESGSLFELPAEIDEARLDLTAALSPSERAAHALHWVRLATGDFYRRFPRRFPRDGRADRVLLEELTAVRRRLQQQGLARHDDTIHDLLARIVFAQFLFDRKDADGTAALNPSLLGRLRDEGYLHDTHTKLATILADYDEAYRFFRWLNEKFNGDLFPGKGKTKRQREAEWQAEVAIVEPRHLKTLSDFVGGQMRGHQRTLWRLYRFDVIPLEFISSVYEEFVASAGAHYTPGFLVDFILDEVLPWDGDSWKVKILDPACGSGIFLVKAYQRLIQRWKNANAGRKPSAAVLRQLLKSYLYGCDIDPHAVRVASFSLYLTMCDEIDPKNYLKNTKFPRLRDERLIHADFFREDKPGLSTANDGPTYDLVVGNAPWGKNTETEFARGWARASEHNWPIANKAVGTLFLAKAVSLTKPGGRVSMIQPASSLLFNRSGPANRFREKLFSEFRIEEVVNLSTLRFELFEDATSPPCIVTMRPSAPDGEALLYISPKQVKPAGGADVAESSYSIVIEPHDISQVLPDEAAYEPNVWTALAWGGRRDFVLVKRLSQLDTLDKYRKAGVVASREGMIRGDRKRRQDDILNRPLLEQDDFPAGTLLLLNADRLVPNEDPFTHSRDSTAYEAFELPQLLIKQGWTVDSSRFRAAVVRSRRPEGVICSQSYISVHAASEHAQILAASAVTYNSILAVYYLLLSSGRLASYRPEPLVEDMRAVPLPILSNDVLMSVTSLQEVDEQIRAAFGFRDAEWALVEDLFTYTLPDFKGDEGSPGRQPTERKPQLKTAAGREPHLSAYCKYFLDVLKGGFGDDKPVCATIYQDAPQTRLPVRVVAIHLDWDRQESIVVEPIDSADLCQRLVELDEKFLQVGDASRGGIFFQRIARVYVEERQGRQTIPTIYIIKPDRIRYWTRSAGMRDADEVAADMWTWQAAPPSTNTG
jgi:hypothetical protein